MAHLSYFSLKSNLSFQQIENLIGTGGVCGLDVGDINHSSKYIIKFLSLSNICLINKTCEWAKKQDNLTVTLDIGTEYGIPLLAVLLINDGKSKLADIIPLVSKKGADVANTCVQACTQSGQLDINLLKEKIVGITADGAFAKK